MNKTIKAYKEAKEEYEKLPEPPNQLAVVEYVRYVVNKEWNKDKINSYEKKEFSNFMSKWNAETQKQTSKTALQEMKQELEDDIEFLKPAWTVPEKEKLENKKQKLNKINKVLEE